MRTTAPTAEPEPPALTGVAKTLDDAEQLYTLRKLAEAKQGYLNVLQQTDSKPVQSAAYYGMARIAVLRKIRRRRRSCLRRACKWNRKRLSKDGCWFIWASFRSPRERRDKAAQYFHDALQVIGASDKAREEAQKGLQMISKQ